MIIHIENFIRNAEFGPVKIGMTKKEVIQKLGEPDADQNMGENGCILLYSWYEFFISKENQLYAMQNDSYNPLDSNTYTFQNGKIEVDSWFLNDKKNQSIGDVVKLLVSKDIVYNIEEYFGREVIKTDSGVIIDFNDEENESGIKDLVGVLYWPKF